MPRVARHSARPASEDQQPVCCRCLVFRIGSSAVQVSEVVRSASHRIRTRRRQLIEPVARRPSSACAARLWASGWVGCQWDASRGLPQEKATARVTEARSWRVLRSQSAAAVRTTSAVAESVGYSTPAVDFGRALVLRARAVCEPTSEARCASGRVRSTSSSVAQLTARLWWAVPLQRRLRAARFRLCMIAFVSSACVRRAEGCPEPTLTNCPARHRIYLVIGVRGNPL